MSSSGAVLLAALFLVVTLAVACSDESTEPTGETSGSGPSREETSTSSPTSSPSGGETTEDTAPPDATLGSGSDRPSTALRVEGAPSTTFSGICSVGTKDNVLSGQVPKVFAFNLRGRRLSCRIQKQDAGSGVLKVILTADGTTRSVQQTNSPSGTISISYQSQ